ncbi:MAG: Smr/MutS family protein [Thiotrichales bacterium]|nr:Smr/MutS family protein [Thiotrichales bacterium]
MDDEEKQMFSAAMQDVTPLTPKPVHHAFECENSAEKAHRFWRQTRQKQRQPLPPELALDRKALFAKVAAFETLSYAQPGVRPQELNRLKKGELYFHAQLDLHGMDEQQARRRLTRFLAEAIAHRSRTLRIIHGKGYNSDSAHPVLKNVAYELLMQCPAVIAFCSAHEKDGGVGAVNVLLRAQEDKREKQD